MSHFNDYSKYYDLLYKEKNYYDEVQYINEIIKLNCPNSKSLLDIGCGTGKHANLLQQLGYNIDGIDLSETMLEIAKNKFGENINFYNADIRKFDLNKKYDTIISLFHVLSYQVKNHDLDSAFESVYKHLNDGGYFIFDCWYGPGVMNDPPSIRVRNMKDDEVEIIRISEPDINYNNSTVDVNFKIIINDLKTDKVKILHEKHPMRYLFKNEIEFLANKYNFKIVSFYSWMSFDVPNKNDWQVVFVLKK
jgi:SAM-dependent methyltransferase